jgi:hypothetical protein
MNHDNGERQCHITPLHRRVGKTQVRTKYSWKRLSFVSSGWNVVSICRPCRKATILCESYRPESPSSWTISFCNFGTRLIGKRAIISIGGFSVDRCKAKTTYSRKIQWIQRCGWAQNTYRSTNKYTHKWSGCIPQTVYWKRCLERLNLREAVLTDEELQNMMFIPVNPNHSEQRWLIFRQEVPGHLFLCSQLPVQEESLRHKFPTRASSAETFVEVLEVQRA